MAESWSQRVDRCSTNGRKQKWDSKRQKKSSLGSTEFPKMTEKRISGEQKGGSKV